MVEGGMGPLGLEWVLLCDGAPVNPAPKRSTGALVLGLPA